MSNSVIKAAVLGATGYVGLELINILSKYSDIELKFLGSQNIINKDIRQFDKRIINNNLPDISHIDSFDSENLDFIFLALPHKVSHQVVKKIYLNKKSSLPKIIDLSADFRINNEIDYKKNYENDHSCPELLSNFVYGLPEINSKLIKVSDNVAVPGCYPTSILLPLIPLIKNELIKSENIIIDSKSGYSGAGKKFDKNHLFKVNDFNFYNYNTNEHRHICEIKQELSKFSKKEIKFSFNPHILPIFRGMMSTIYCDLNKSVDINDIKNCLNNYYKTSKFIKLFESKTRNDFFKVQNTNNCYLNIFNHYDDSKIIIVSLIDNLLKGASGQAIQCMSLMNNETEDYRVIK